MTGNPIGDLVISVFGIALIVGLVRILFPARAPARSPDDLAAYLRREEPDFEVGHWLHTDNAILVSDRIGADLIIIIAHGGDLVHRRVSHSGLRIEIDAKGAPGGTARLDPGDPTFGTLDLPLPLPPEWAFLTSRHG